MNSKDSGKGVGSALVGEVVDTFLNKGKGRVLMIDVESPPAGVGPGDLVEIRWPEGRTMQIRLEAVDLCAGRYDTTIGLYLPSEFDSLENPRGAKIWKPS